MFNLKLSGLLFLGILLCAGLPSVAAETATPSRAIDSGWGSFGFGMDVSGDPAVYVGLTLATANDRVYTVRIAGVTKLEENIAPDKSVSDFSILYGKRFHPESFLSVTANVGVAFTARVKRGKYEGIKHDDVEGKDVPTYEQVSKGTIGLAVEGEAYLTSLRYVGIGLNAFGNINAEQPYLAVGLCLHLGYLR
jgi:hypothetical protein